MVESKKKLDELAPPPQAFVQGGYEVLRAFIVDKGLQVSLRRSFDDAATWGIMLADIARHASRIYARESEISEEQALARIRSLFDAELDRPTDLGTTSARN
jgi:hypothetical protein